MPASFNPWGRKLSANNLDVERWNRKYRNIETAPDWTADPELTHFSDQIGKCGLALDLACGTGKNALYLARLGYRVVALDAALEGLRHCARAARQNKLSVDPICADLALYPLPKSCFDLIVVVRYLNRTLFPTIYSALKPGGLLFYKTLNQNLLKQQPDFNPDYLLQHGELERAFPELTILESNRGEDRSTSFILARK